METVVSHIFSSNDYSQFKTLEGNRNVNSLHVKRLKDSFQKNYLISPILVNQQFQIIDGQHRFEAAKQLGLPINYAIQNDYGVDEVKTLNTNTKNWNRIDYLVSYCTTGHPEYLKFKEFMSMFPELSPNCCTVLLTNKNNGVLKRVKLKKSERLKVAQKSYSIKDFENGSLVIPDFNNSVENAKKIMKIKPYYSGYNRVVFIRAMVALFKRDNFDFNTFMKKMELNPTALKHCVSIAQYIDLIENIYNYHCKNKQSFKY